MEATTMSDLQFQENIVDVPRRFRSFYGKIVDQMPLLLSGKDEAGIVVDVPRVPLTPKQLLYERVHEKNEHDQKLLRGYYVDTACAVITDSSGEVIVGLYSDPLVKELIYTLNPKSRIKHGSLPVGADEYQEIRKNAFVIPADVASNLRSSAYNEQGVKEGFWDYVVEGDAELIRDYLSLVKRHRGESMGNSMCLYVSANPGLRLLCAESVRCDYGGSAGKYDHLGGNIGRLVGVVAPEAHSTKSARRRAARKNEGGPYREPAQVQGSRLEETVRAALHDGRAFEYGELCYVPVPKGKGVTIE